MNDLAHTLTDLKERFLELHTRREDLFWIVKMGTADDSERAERELGEAEIAWHRFLQDAARLRELRALDGANAGTPQEHWTLRGWIALFAAHTIESAEARALSEEIAGLEQQLARRRRDMPLGYVDPRTGELERASSVKLALMVRAEPDEALRRAAFEGLRSIETFVLDAGFLDIVRKRNRLGRMLGYEDYYDWRVAVTEHVRKRDLFRTLDDLAARTRDRALDRVAAFERAHGAGSLEPHNFPFLRAGELLAELDPYFPFSRALERWFRSFHALGVRFRGAALTLDLVDRPGKYENGFMHGPEPAFFEGESWRPARINFTANAVPGQVSSGMRAIETLFHEGGHAAHFSNILSDAPCFSQEFAPTSVAYAETQSMFMDSLLEDADWRVRHATDEHGAPMPLELIEAWVRESQPFRGWDVRAMLTVPLAERRLYEIPDSELSPERVLGELRRIEAETQGLPSGGVRPVLAVPHLLESDSSAYYHGYVLAEMAVEQTRRFFLERDGRLADNDKIGPDLARAYWSPGNSVGFDETLERLTGAPLSADALVDACNEPVDEACAAARAAAERARSEPAADGGLDLDATIRVVHGGEVVASTEQGGYEGAAAAFAKWIAGLEAGAR